MGLAELTVEPAGQAAVEEVVPVGAAALLTVGLVAALETRVRVEVPAAAEVFPLAEVMPPAEVPGAGETTAKVAR